MRIGSSSRKITLANSKLRAVWGSGALSTACHSLLPLSRFRLDLGLIHIPLIVGPLLGSEVLDMSCTFDSHTTIQRLGMLFNIAHGASGPGYLDFYSHETKRCPVLPRPCETSWRRRSRCRMLFRKSRPVHPDRWGRAFLATWLCRIQRVEQGCCRSLYQHTGCPSQEDGLQIRID